VLHVAPEEPATPLGGKPFTTEPAVPLVPAKPLDPAAPVSGKMETSPAAPEMFTVDPPEPDPCAGRRDGSPVMHATVVVARLAIKIVVKDPKLVSRRLRILPTLPSWTSMIHRERRAIANTAEIHMRQIAALRCNGQVTK
jgi:hypothetical protein